MLERIVARKSNDLCLMMPERRAKCEPELEMSIGKRRDASQSSLDIRNPKLFVRWLRRALNPRFAVPASASREGEVRQIAEDSLNPSMPRQKSRVLAGQEFVMRRRRAWRCAPKSPARRSSKAPDFDKSLLKIFPASQVREPPAIAPPRQRVVNDRVLIAQPSELCPCQRRQKSEFQKRTVSA